MDRGLLNRAISTILIFFLGSAAAQCNGTTMFFNEGSGIIVLPESSCSFPSPAEAAYYEYGYSNESEYIAYGGRNFETANYSWTFSADSEDRALILTVMSWNRFLPGDGDTSYGDDSYFLTINGGKTRLFSFPNKSYPRFCNTFYASASCKPSLRASDCATKLPTDFPVKVRYEKPGERFDVYDWGFVMYYEFAECQGDRIKKEHEETWTGSSLLNEAAGHSSALGWTSSQYQAIIFLATVAMLEGLLLIT